MTSRRRLTAIVAATLLAGCAVRPPVPDWRLDLRQAVEQGVAAELQARDRGAALHWARAEQAARSAADAQALARVALLRCALRLAAAQPGACRAAEPFLPDASAAERAYAAWLAGALPPPAAEGAGGAMPVTLPASTLALRALGPTPDPATALVALRGLDDPVSRLVAGGWLWQAGRLDSEGVALLVDTAAAQGWRRPLAAWLAVQQRLAEQTGDVATAQRARRRLAWLLQSGSDAAPAP
ncbi:hypothetical protein Tsedi_01338 [Tepidimonas sediminis]|uniref:Lipoprotein n=1 Tax=Tepidimonas sediminis TaxID=2588941 RepID=A0A554WPB7_9BURK|nr:hypothetical protein [Tepidimonas sediminis]TSE25421.1 hypothetical protein Tsedi_01338 [Tepidimonas sediminis]